MADTVIDGPHLRCEIDECTLTRDRLHLRGWAYAEERRIVTAEIMFSGETLPHPLPSYGVTPSPDVAVLLGPGAAQVRIDEWLALPAGASDTFSLHLRFEDGTTWIGPPTAWRKFASAETIAGRIDDLLPDAALEALDFYVAGWCYGPDRDASVQAVEVWSGAHLIGSTAQLFVRPDVSAALALADEVATGFVVHCHHVDVAPGESFAIAVRARFSDGGSRRIAGGESIPLRALPLERSPMAALRALARPDALGVEIGAHENPASGVTPCYTDVVCDFAGTAGRLDFLADGQALPLADGSLDYLCSSHVLEHLPNPLAALFEWHRVLRPGGLLYLVVPDRRFTFDQPRALTAPDHLLEDFVRGTTTAQSIEHIREFIFDTDWSRLQPGWSAAEAATRKQACYEAYVAEARAGRLIGIHFHTFTPESFHRFLHAAGFIGGAFARFEWISAAERYPSSRGDGIAVLLRKKGDRARGRPQTFELQRLDPKLPALPLVCPVTLEPLELHVQADGANVLRSVTGGRNYRFENGRPNAIPPDDARPLRAWARPLARAIVYARGRLRRSLGAEPKSPAARAG